MYNFTHAPDMEGYTIRMTKVNVKQGRKSPSDISLLSFNSDMGEATDHFLGGGIARRPSGYPVIPRHEVQLLMNCAKS